MLGTLPGKVVDHTEKVYGKHVPEQIIQGKEAVLASLLPQQKMVKRVTFLENFNRSNAETAFAQAPRYTGVVVSLSPDYQLSAADQVWLNGPYGQQLSVWEMNEGKACKALGEKWMRSDDSQALCGVYETLGQDAFTGEPQTRKFCFVNASAADLSRQMTCRWAQGNFVVRDAYENAATQEFTLKADPSGEDAQAAAESFDNVTEYVDHVSHEMANTLGMCGERDSLQTTNVFVRAANTTVHYLNGGVIPSEHGTLCHVSPLHGFVRLPAVEGRQFYPTTLLTADHYVNISALNPAQQGAIFTRALWPQSAETTVNPYALRMSLPNWRASLPVPTETFRMKCANFSLDRREQLALPPAAVVAMTPSKEHSVAGVKMPEHCAKDRVHLHPTQSLLDQLVQLRAHFDILNPEYFIKEFDQDKNLIGVHLSLPRNIAATLS